MGRGEGVARPHGRKAEGHPGCACGAGDAVPVRGAPPYGYCITYSAPL